MKLSPHFLIPNSKILLIQILLLLPFLSIAFAQTEKDQTDLIKKGEYVAIAADCMACHTAPDNNAKPLAGGYIIELPMGKIVSPNITPSKQFGIGNWSEIDFANAVRKGISPTKGNLYPAMPYTAYHGITDEDIHALYTYIMLSITPVDEPLVEETTLSFPFEYRQLMTVWNKLYLDDKIFTPDPTKSTEINRGTYLIDNLAHCGTCHTPRNMLFAENDEKALSGSNLGGWFAPNITADNSSGIGSWSKEEIVTFLKTGHLENKASSAGEMATAVVDSFSKMTDDDLSAIAAALKDINMIHTAVPRAIYNQRNTIEDINQIYSGQGDYLSLIDSNTTNGQKLYLNICASCHGIDGSGSEDQVYPSLILNSTVKSLKANNLVLVISEGIHRQMDSGEVFMPGFKQDLNDAQIAAITQYVRKNFASIVDKTSEKDVKAIIPGKQ